MSPELLSLAGAVAGGFVGGWLGGHRKVREAITMAVREAVDAHEARCRFAVAVSSHLAEPTDSYPVPPKG